jgi:pyridinium-3,5-biscarboxylic acid mononucleotide sulfurtransferase
VSNQPHIPPDLRPAWERLLAALSGRGPLLVAFSGGVDSSLLLKAAVLALGPDQVAAALCAGPFTPAWELAQARDLARGLGVELLELEAGELAEPAIVANDQERCYHCKRRRFSLLTQLARQRGFAAVAEGSQLDDQGDYRPGRRAVAELGAVSPLMEAGLDKSQVRGLSRALGLATADAPSSACLATRVPVGVPLTPQALARVGLAEAALRALIPGRVRVRDHFPLARLEVEAGRLGELVAEPLRGQVVAALRGAGYSRVCLDLEGYRASGLDHLPG